MCGIFAAVNTGSVTDNLIHGLSSLTYRGYDSSGIAVIDNGRIRRRRAPGKLKELSDLLKVSPVNGQIGIAHTRWATHGLPNEKNAHPHMTARVAVAHNGIVENHDQLSLLLEASGYIFESETDSETIAQLITYYLDLGLKPERALTRALSEIEGSFGVVVIFSDGPQKLYAARKGSPLVIGKSDDGFYVSSDVNAFDPKVKKITHLKDGDIAKLTKSSLEIFGFTGKRISRPLQVVERDEYDSGKNGYKHFMEKEIFEQPDVFERTWRHYFNNQTNSFQLPNLPFDLNVLDRISIVACGTSFFASMVGKYWLEKHCKIPVDIDISSEYRYRQAPAAKKSASLFVSQSGETADTLAALNHAKSQNQKCVSFVNVLTSSMANESDAILPTLAGPEIGVASTKAFMAQLTSLLIFTQAMSTVPGEESSRHLINQMLKFPSVMHEFLNDDSVIKNIAKDLANASSVLYLGRDIAYPLAEEGALKLKEISYIHAEAYPAGELKHGPLALVDESMPVIFIVPPNELFYKSLSNLREVTSRGGKVILISNKDGVELSKDHIAHGIEMPEVDEMLVPLLYTLPLQMLAYHTAIIRGNDVDQPRNLAKSVTVE